MKSEYVGLNYAERNYGMRQLLQLQLEILNIIKRVGRYRELRSEELVLKVALKSKIAQAREDLKELQKLLPRTEYQLEKSGDGEEVYEEDLTLEKEIAEIRKKLGKLKD